MVTGVTVTVRGGGSGVLWKPEETSKGIGQVGVMLLQAPLHLEGLEQLLKLPHVVDCSPNNRCLISLENFYEKNNEIMNKQNVMDEEKKLNNLVIYFEENHIGIT